MNTKAATDTRGIKMTGQEARALEYRELLNRDLREMYTRAMKSEGIPFWLSVDKVYYNGDATIVKWYDGTKTVVHCTGEDKAHYSRELGLALCYMKKIAGNGTILERMLEPAFDERNVQKPFEYDKTEEKTEKPISVKAVESKDLDDDLDEDVETLQEEVIEEEPKKTEKNSGDRFLVQELMSDDM